jgi:hypothetical protein
MEQNINPFFAIQQDILEVKTLVEQLIYNQTPVNLPDLDKYEGIEVAVEELKCKKQTIYQNIDRIPHKKVHNRLLFNRAELRAYIKNEGRNQ